MVMKMYRYDDLRLASERVREHIKSGMRVRLIDMDDAQAPKKGTLGTVQFVDDVATIHVRWDNGSSLGLVYGEDRFEIVEG